MFVRLLTVRLAIEMIPRFVLIVLVWLPVTERAPFTARHIVVPVSRQGLRWACGRGIRRSWCGRRRGVSSLATTLAMGSCPAPLLRLRVFLFMLLYLLFRLVLLLLEVLGWVIFRILWRVLSSVLSRILMLLRHACALFILLWTVLFIGKTISVHCSLTAVNILLILLAILLGTSRTLGRVLVLFLLLLLQLQLLLAVLLEKLPSWLSICNNKLLYCATLILHTSLVLEVLMLRLT